MSRVLADRPATTHNISSDRLKMMMLLLLMSDACCLACLIVKCSAGLSEQIDPESRAGRA